MYDLHFNHCFYKEIIQYKKALKLLQKNLMKAKTDWILTIIPSKKFFLNHFKKIYHVIFGNRIKSYAPAIVKITNLLIWRWCNYFRYYNCPRRLRLSQYVTFFLFKHFFVRGCQNHRRGKSRSWRLHRAFVVTDCHGNR